MEKEKETAVFVLVLGGGHGAWCYGPVKQLLENAGQSVYALSLPGIGERAMELTPDTGLEDHVNAVVEFILEENLQDVILVGHSYGGMVITGTADRVPDRIRHIVYLDAVHPADGQNLLDAQPMARFVPAVSVPRIIDGVEICLYPDDETLAFLGLTKPEDIAFAREHLTPHPYRSFTDKLYLKQPDIASKIGSTHIHTAKTLEGLMMMGCVPDGMEDAMVIDTGHDLMITEPQQTADMLLKVAKKTEQR